MRNIRGYEAEKYATGGYRKVAEGVYRTVDEDFPEGVYVTSLSFEQEPGLGEGADASDISQYPLEDVLDEFFVHVNDFYEELNVAGSETCYLEFGSPDVENVERLRTVIGKHVYLVEERGRDGRVYCFLKIEDEPPEEEPPAPGTDSGDA